jgi:predicted dehydrogenase
VSKNLIENNRALADSQPEVFGYNYELSPLEAELQHWVSCIKTRTQPTTNVESARAVAKVIDQVKKLI